MIAAPVVSPADPNSHLAVRSLWLPQGEWIEWPTGAHINGPAQITRTFVLDEIPVYVCPGAIIPLAPKMSSTTAHPLDPLILQIFSGKTGEGKLYEDEGDLLGYKTNQFSWTHFQQQTNPDGSMQIKILPRGRVPRNAHGSRVPIASLRGLAARISHREWQGNFLLCAR